MSSEPAKSERVASLPTDRWASDPLDQGVTQERVEQRQEARCPREGRCMWPPKMRIRERRGEGKTGPGPPLKGSPSEFSRPRPKMSSEPAKSERVASLPTVQSCANHTSGGTERTKMRGTATRSAQPKGEDPVPVNRGFDDLLLVECIRTTPHFYLGVERWAIGPSLLRWC